MDTPGISKLVSVQMSERTKGEPTGEGENAAPAGAVAA
jgi:hypothetical protein